MVNLTSRPFFPRKELWFSLNGKLGGLHSRAARLRDEKYLFPLPGFEPHNSQPAAGPYKGSGLFDLIWTLQNMQGDANTRLMNVLVTEIHQPLCRSYAWVVVEA